MIRILSRKFSARVFRIAVLVTAAWLVIQSVTRQQRGLEEAFPKTDFSNAIVAMSEIRPGGPPRDGIPALDEPRFIPADRAGWLDPDEPVVVVSAGGETRACPLQIMIWHEIVNDGVAGMPVVVLAGDAARSTLDRRRISDSRKVPSLNAFDRRVGDRVLTFDRDRDAIVDRETGSRWNALGRAVAGPLAGERLEPVTGGVHFAFAWLAFRPDSAIFRR